MQIKECESWNEFPRPVLRAFTTIVFVISVEAAYLRGVQESTHVGLYTLLNSDYFVI